MALLSLTGLIAGLVTAGLDYPVHRLCREHPSFGWLILGGPFGAAVAVSLATCRVLRGISGFWRAILLVALSSGTYFVSLCLAVGVELAVTSGKQLSMGQTNSPVSMFAGGFAGGLLVLGGAFLLVYPRSGFGTGTTTLKVLFASVLCGILGIVGWTLGPYLGIHVWSMMHTLGLTPSTETFQNALHGDTSCQYSLFVVWQTCTAFLLGLILQARAQTQVLTR
jgi:hypothetical protein